MSSLGTPPSSNAQISEPCAPSSEIFSAVVSCCRRSPARSVKLFELSQKPMALLRAVWQAYTLLTLAPCAGRAAAASSSGRSMLSRETGSCGWGAGWGVGGSAGSGLVWAGEAGRQAWSVAAAARRRIRAATTTY